MFLESAWKIKTSINGKDKEICVAVGAKSSICQWNLNSDAVFKFVSIDDCVSNESLLCSKIFDEEKFCTKKKIEEENDQEEIILTRYKRDANDTAAGGGEYSQIYNQRCFCLYNLHICNSRREWDW